MVRSYLRGAGLAAAFALSFGLLPVVLHAQEGDAEARPRVERVEFRGVDALDERLVRESIATQATSCRSLLMRPFCWVSDAPVWKERHYLDSLEVARDELRIRVLYFQRGYRHTQVGSTVQPRGDGVEVVFAVEEGEPTRVASLLVTQADSVLGGRQIESAGLPGEGEPLDLIRLDSARTRLSDLLQDEGYLDAIVRDTVRVDTASRRAAVEVALDPGRRSTVDSIRVAGNEQVDERVIRTALDLREGEVLSRGGLRGSQRNLYESNLFRQALIEVPPQADSAKVVEVTVREAPLRLTSTGIGINTVDFLQAEAGYTQYDFLGGGRVLDVRGVVGNLFASQLSGRGPFHDVIPSRLSDGEAEAFERPTWQASVTLSLPGFRSSQRNTVALSAFAHRRTVPGIAVDRGYGGGPTFTRKLALNTPASLSYRYEATSVEAGGVYYCLNYGICAPALVETLREWQSLSPLSFSVFSDRADNPLEPTRGFTARFDAEHASSLTLSDFRYHRLSGEYARYQPVRRGHVLAGRVRAGWVHPLSSTGEAVGLEDPASLLHPRTRFYAGGSRSVRGYGENQLGPRILTVASERLTDAELESPCTVASIAGGTCDPGGVPSSAFDPRPLGGTRVVEASLEYRFPLWGPVIGAGFVDAGWVGAASEQLLSGGRSAVTPGFGVRYLSPIGPIRVDLGIKPTLAERLPVVTEIVDGNGVHRLVPLAIRKRYDPLEGSGGGLRQVLSRLQLHLSIGEAF